MPAKPAKLTYIAAQFRVRCEFSKALADESSMPPEDLIRRAKEKLETEKNKGTVEFYRFFETRLNRMWLLMRKSHASPDTVVAVTLAAGAPAMPGIDVIKGVEANELGSLSIHAKPEDVAKWKHSLFKLTLGQKLREIGVLGVPNPAQIRRIYFHAKAGDTVRNVILIPAPSFPEQLDDHEPYTIEADDVHHDVTLAVFDVNVLADKSRLEAMVDEVQEKIVSVSEGRGVQYKVLFTDIVRTLRSARRGPEAYGLDMPIVLLAAVEERLVKATNLATKTKTILKKHLSRSQKETKPQKQGPVLDIGVSRDKMKVAVRSFDERLYEKGLVSEEWIQSELVRRKVIADVSDGMRERIRTMIRREESLQGIVVAQGEPVVHGSFPELKEVPRRGYVVHTDDLVAEFVYQVEPKNGKDVFGNVIEATREVPPNINIDENIEQRGHQFFAKVDGVPEVEAFGVTLQKYLVHDGDVNAASEPLVFEGNVEINGSVEAGAVLWVDGDVIVNGTIAEAEVMCTGRLAVEGGITTGHDGFVKCGKKLIANFIGNSNVRAGGDVVVETAITASNVVSGASVVVKANDGHISAGIIEVHDRIVCANLGKGQGAGTEVYVGTDIKLRRHIDLLKSRARAIHRTLKEVQRMLDYKEKNNAAADLKIIRDAKSKKEKCERILKTLERRLDECHLRKMDHNEKALIIVKNVLSKNVQISIAGRTVKLHGDVQGVRIRHHEDAKKMILTA